MKKVKRRHLLNLSVNRPCNLVKCRPYRTFRDISLDAVSLYLLLEEEISTSLVKEDTLNKALSPAFLAQKICSVEAFPKLVITRMTSRNLLIDFLFLL